MSQETPGTGRALARRDIEAVIRRATELSLADADARELISEQELVRIAAELGLPTQHVLQAIYERPSLEAEPRWYDRWYPSPILAQSRTVSGRAEERLRTLEHYLCTREYLQVVRRRPHEIAMLPAEDAISKVARVFLRPGGRFRLARAERVVVAVHPVAPGSAHVRVETDYAAERGGYVGRGTMAGTAAGLLAGALIEAGTGGIGGFGLLAGSLAGAGTGIAIAARAFRARLALARRELAHLLDRVETGERLEPPAAPWRRSLQQRLFGPQR